MLKKTSIIAMTVLMTVLPLAAQPKESCECAFGPKKGQWEVSLNLGRGQFFNDAKGLYYLLPAEDGTAIGIGTNSNEWEMVAGTGNDHISGDIATYVLNTGSMNANSIVNIAGINAKYFFTDNLAITFGGAYNMNMQPGKDYVEGERTVIGENGGLPMRLSAAASGEDLSGRVYPGDIYGQKAVLGVTSNSGIANLGLDWYFHLKRAPRVTPYVGVLGQFKIARIDSYYPYTGQMFRDDIDELIDDRENVFEYENLDLYRTNRIGQAFGFAVGLTFGVDFSVTENLILGINVAPVMYQYNLVQLQVMGQDTYNVYNHNISAFKYPQLKFGFRF